MRCGPIPHRLLLTIATVAAAALFSGCVSADREEPIAEGTPTTLPTPSSASPSPTPPPTSQPTPDPTPPPTSQPTPDPTPTLAVSPSPLPQPTRAATPTPAPAAPQYSGWITLAELLTLVTIATEQSEGYNRDDWNHWVDADGDGLDTRQEVLAEEALADPLVEGGRIREGQWYSHYDGEEITVARQLDVDHVVALAEAHQSGGWAWDALTRQLYANDLSLPEHLIAVSAGTNRSKGARDPAEWLPPDSEALCTYLAWWTTIKYRWQLTMDQAEYNTILHHATNDCADTQIDLTAAQSGIIRADTPG